MCTGGTCTSSITYTPAADYNGADSFTFSVNDGRTTSNVANVSITVRAANDAPKANDTAIATDEDTPVTITLTASDIDSTHLSFNVISGPSHGLLAAVAAPSCTVTANPDGSSGRICNATVTYTPFPDYNGSDSFMFQASDGNFPSPCQRSTIVPLALASRCQRSRIRLSGLSLQQPTSIA